jgi:hypothetical protein
MSPRDVISLWDEFSTSYSPPGWIMYSPGVPKYCKRLHSNVDDEEICGEENRRRFLKLNCRSPLFLRVRRSQWTHLDASTTGRGPFT